MSVLIQKLEKTEFSWKKIEIYPILIFFFIIHYLWSQYFPIADIEAYYWDWSRNLNLSYYDHPGAVAWICRLGTWLTQNQSNLRIMVPIFSNISLIFLILTMNEILSFENKKANLKQILYLEILYNTIPVFSIQSFILMPDFALITSLSIVLYISIKIIKNIYIHNKIPVMLTVFLGASAGFGLNSKFHMLPIIIIILITITLLKKIELKKLIIFYLIFTITFLIFSFPVIYWNFKNNFASVLFQLNHGFGHSDFNFMNPISFILESAVYITPLLFIYAFQKIFYINKFYNNINFHEKLELISLLPICGICIIFFISSFYDYAAPYWISPAFFLLIPFISINMSNWKYNKYFICLFLSITLIIPSILCFKSARKSITQISHGTIGYKIFFWNVLNDARIEKLSGINLPKSVPNNLLKQRNCSKDETLIASLNWTWTAQLAYHLKDHPYVYNISPYQKSYYSFRDNLDDLKNCKIVVIASENLIHDVLHKFKNISLLKSIHIKIFENSEEFSNVSILTGIYLGEEKKKK